MQKQTKPHSFTGHMILSCEACGIRLETALREEDLTCLGTKTKKP
jgi:hypothetical protein